MARKVVEALVQCWACGHVQTLKRVRPCQRCGGAVEVLRTVDGNGVVTTSTEGPRQTAEPVKGFSGPPG